MSGNLLPSVQTQLHTRARCTTPFPCREEEEEEEEEEETHAPTRLTGLLLLLPFFKVDSAKSAR